MKPRVDRAGMLPLSLLLVCTPCLSPAAQAIGGGTFSVKGVFISYKTLLEPPVPAITKHGGGTLTEDAVAKRHVCNFDNFTYFGYDVSPELLADGRVRLRFSPLSIVPDQMARIFHERPGSWTALPRPQGGGALMDVRPGDTVAIDLFVNPNTGQRLTDYLTVSLEKNSVAAEPKIEGPARDFRVEDVELRVGGAGPVVIDGVPGPRAGGGSVAGQALWLDLPGHGRFLFSLVPRPDLGMRLAGEIRGRELQWREGGRAYSVRSDQPIVPGARAYHLYVLMVPRQAQELSWSAGSRPEDALAPRK